jgi:hypothetical protein
MSVESVFAVISKLVATPPTASVSDALATINTFETSVCMALFCDEWVVPYQTFVLRFSGSNGISGSQGGGMQCGYPSQLSDQRPVGRDEP